ncbi:MAG: hypothetical protein KFW07_01360, partial [Mycoplasmataceae bacterium]|nr:hypothetical protein [Mycoplasmataceae bacterium]
MINTADKEGRKIKFFYSELVPLETPFNVHIHKFYINKKRKNGNIPINWSIYEMGKIKMITCPSPSNFELIFKKWIALENIFFEQIKKRSISINQYPCSTYKNKNKKSEHSIFSDSYFKYENRLKYNKMVELVSEKSENPLLYASKLDIKAYFSSIYIHSIEWVFYEGTFYERKLKKNKLTDNKQFPTNIHSIATNLSSNQTNGLPIGPNLSRIISNII